MGGTQVRGRWAAAVAVLVVLVGGACNGDPYASAREASRALDAKSQKATEEAKESKAGTQNKIVDTEPAEDESETAGARQAFEITATDYAFETPANFTGGLVDLTLVNGGKEPHFAAFAQPKEGVTPEMVRKALRSPPAEGAGPPPFVEFAALGTVDPGGESRMTMNLPTGPYVLFCALPAASDGIPHTLKGMLADVDVKSGPTKGLPETDATFTVADFAIGGPLEFKAGTTSVTMTNKGKQIHELDLVEIPEGKTVEDIVAWAARLEGPPPAKFLGGPAVRDGLSVTTTFEMKTGVTYAFVCIVLDSLGDFAPHIIKGMRSASFQVEP